MRTRPGSPGTAPGWDASAFPWIFSPSLFPPFLIRLRPAPPPSPGPGAGRLCPRGRVAFPGNERSKSPCLMGHVALRWQPKPLPELCGCSRSSAPNSIEPNPPSIPRPPTSRAPAPLEPLLPSRSAWPCTSRCLCSSAGTRNLARPVHLGLHVPPCLPAPCHHHKTRHLSLCVPPVLRGCSPRAQPQPGVRARRLGLFWGCSHKNTSKRTQSPVLLSLLSPLCPLCPKLCPLAAWPCIAQRASPRTSCLPGRFPWDTGNWLEQLRRAAETSPVNTEKKAKRVKEKKKKDGKCTYAK